MTGSLQGAGPEDYDVLRFEVGYGRRVVPPGQGRDRLPERPAGTEAWDVPRLAALVARNSMIGVDGWPPPAGFGDLIERACAGTGSRAVADGSTTIAIRSHYRHL